MNPAVSILALLSFLWAWSGHAAELAIDPESILPEFDEPKWSEVEYSAIPKGTEMKVRMSSEDVTKAIWKKHAGRYDSNKAQLELREERAILSEGAYFRRMLMFLTDFRKRSDHGYCGEYIAIWFAPPGNIHGFYFSERMCPV